MQGEKQKRNKMYEVRRKNDLIQILDRLTGDGDKKRQTATAGRAEIKRGRDLGYNDEATENKIVERVKRERTT